MDTNVFNIVITIISIILLVWDIWQLASSRKDKEIQVKERQLHKAQVKIWQHFANGISHNLSLISQTLNKKTDNQYLLDLSSIIGGVQAITFSLYTSLNEERLFTDEEIKRKQLEQEKEFKEEYRKSKPSIQEQNKS